MTSKRVTIGRTFSSAPVARADNPETFTRTFTLPSGKQALFTLKTIDAGEIETKTFVLQETNGRDQSALTPESLRDITRTFSFQQFFPAIGIQRGDRIEILDGSRRRAAALLCERGLDILVTASAISATEARQFARDLQTAREHNLREIGLQLLQLKKAGMSQKEIAQAQELSPSKVTRALQAAAVPAELIALFPVQSELGFADYKSLLQISEQATANDISLSDLCERTHSRLEETAVLHGLPSDEAKSLILKLIRQSIDLLVTPPTKESVITQTLWQFADKDRFARKKIKGRMFAYEFNRLPKTVQDELDRLIEQTLRKHLPE